MIRVKIMKIGFMIFAELLLYGCASSVIYLPGNTRYPLTTPISQDAARSIGLSDGLYFGASNVDRVSRAWIIRIAKPRATLYIPPLELDIPNINIDEDSKFWFTSEAGLAGERFKFFGTGNGNDIKGRIVSELNNERNARTESFEVELALINDGAVTPFLAPGLYSNKTYNEETGDFTGNELVLIHSDNGIVGCFTSLENEMTPYFIKIVGANKKQLNFHIETENGRQDFIAKFAKSKIWLTRVGSVVSKHQTSMLMLRKPIADFLPIATKTLN